MTIKGGSKAFMNNLTLINILGLKSSLIYQSCTVPVLSPDILSFSLA